MMSRRYGEQSRVAFQPPEKITTILAGIFLVLSLVPMVIAVELYHSGSFSWLDQEALADFWGNWYTVFTLLTLIMLVLTLILIKYTPERIAIRQMLRYRLFSKAGGNPLGLKSESVIPSLDVKDDGEGRYRVIIDTTACSADTLVKLPKIIIF